MRENRQRGRPGEEERSLRLHPTGCAGTLTGSDRRDGQLGPTISTPTLLRRSRNPASARETHVATVRESGDIRLYVNGKPDGYAHYSPAVFTSTGDVWLGRSQIMNAPNVFAGTIDETRISGVARYKGGLTPDASGHGNHGLLLASAAIVPGGQFDKCLSLNGTTDYVTIPDSASLALGTSDFTIEAWVNPTDLSQPRAIVAKWWESQCAYKLDLRSGKLNLWLTPNGTQGSAAQFTGGTTIQTGVWTHVAATRAGNTITLYVNDVADGTFTYTQGVFAGTAPLLLGRNGVNNQPNYFVGLLDEIRIDKVDRHQQFNTTETDYYYNVANQLTKSLSGTNSVLYGYDPNGNQILATHKGGDTVVGVETMGYDFLNRQTSWTGPAGSETFAYRGAEWHRKSLGGTGLLYDGDNVIADLAGGAVSRLYVTPYLDENISMTVTGGSQIGTYYYSQDERQSVRTLTDATGVAVAKYDYTAFGEPVQVAGSPAPVVQQRYTYTGRELNPYSVNFYFRYRTYGPGIGAFTARDPAGYLGGMSLYAGVFAARNRVDPSGQGTFVVSYETKTISDPQVGPNNMKNANLSGFSVLYTPTAQETTQCANAGNAAQKAGTGAGSGEIVLAQVISWRPNGNPWHWAIGVIGYQRPAHSDKIYDGLNAWDSPTAPPGSQMEAVISIAAVCRCKTSKTLLYGIASVTLEWNSDTRVMMFPGQVPAPTGTGSSKNPFIFHAPSFAPSGDFKNTYPSL